MDVVQQSKVKAYGLAQYILNENKNFKVTSQRRSEAVNFAFFALFFQQVQQNSQKQWY